MSTQLYNEQNYTIQLLDEITKTNTNSTKKKKDCDKSY